MKKYFNFADIIILLFIIFGIACITVYKFYWTNTVPVLSNADKCADIIYTISTSVVASGMFYLLTIFIPKYFKINNMLKDIKNTTSSIDFLSKQLVDSIPKGTSDERYSLNDFILTVNNNNTKAESHFLLCYFNSNSNKLITRILMYQINDFECIYYNYNQLLLDNTKKKLVNIFKSQQNSLNMSSDIPDNNLCLYQLYYNMFKEIIILNEEIKRDYIL